MTCDTKKADLSIKEVANLLNISVQAVYQRLEKDFKPYLKNVKGKKRLDSAVLELIPTKETSSTLTSDFKEVLKLLEKQLEEKDRQLAVKDVQIQELNNRLEEAHKMVTQAQQLHGAEKVLQLEESSNSNFFKRILENRRQSKKNKV